MEKALEIKSAIAAAITMVGVVLGWHGILAVVWVICMILDWISGSLAAAQAGEWCSADARKGAWHKGGMVLIVLAAWVADIAISVACTIWPTHIDWPGAVMPMVMVWHIVTEIGSILENAIKMGAPCPQWLLRRIKGAKDAMDAVGKDKEENCDENIH